MSNFFEYFEGIQGWMIVKSCGEIFIIFILLYTILRILQGTHGTGMLRSLAFILVITSVVILFFIKKLDLRTVNWLVIEFLPVFFIPIIILFQPEFRRALIRLGHIPFFRMFFKTEVQVADEMVKAISTLSKSKTGGLIAIEREDDLDSYIESGTKINSDISSDLINTIFYPSTPLHDGAIIIQEHKIASAGCIFPLTENNNIAKSYGTRHRAGIGITEKTDAISIIISEKTGAISIAIGGQLKEDITKDELRKTIEELTTVTVKNTRSS